jgi:NADH dehydrogenase
VREGKTVAKNIHASCTGKPLKKFEFKSLGMMAALGHHRAVAELFGFLKLSGLFAWILWRAIYWMKLPGIGRKIKVALSWMVETLFPTEAVQLKFRAEDSSDPQCHRC